MATAYDAWKTNVEDTNEEAWNEGVSRVSDKVKRDERDEMVHTLAAADEALDWVCGSVEVPHHQLHAFRDLVKMAERYRRQVEAEMKVYIDDRD